VPHCITNLLSLLQRRCSWIVKNLQPPIFSEKFDQKRTEKNESYAADMPLSIVGDGRGDLPPNVFCNSEEMYLDVLHIVRGTMLCRSGPTGCDNCTKLCFCA
jgi:hypothetical protein